MVYLFLWFALFIWMGFWSSQAGGSFPFWRSWQEERSHGNRIPELVLAVSIGSIGVWGWGKLFPDISSLMAVALWLVLIVISFGGKESGTWGYLNHTGHTKDMNKDGVIDNKDARDGTTTRWNIWLASWFGWKLGDEGFSWVWAFTKGLMTTLPLGGLGCISQPIGREIASHAKGRLKGDPNTYMEFVGDGFGYSVAATAFIFLVNFFT